MKNKAAQELNRLRQQAMTPEERQGVARLGAAARWANTTPEQRKAYSEKMNAAKAKKYGTEGNMCHAKWHRNNKPILPNLDLSP